MTVPELGFVMVDGRGDPNVEPSYRRAVEWLYSSSYAMKFGAKATLGCDYVVPPLEALWWSDDPASFTTREKTAWNWTVMLLLPDFITPEMFDAGVAKAARKLGEAPRSFRRARLDEGICLQCLHVGSYDDEGSILAHLHD